METKNEYTALCNAVSQVIEMLEASIEKDKKILKILKVAQIMSDEFIKPKEDEKK